MGMPVNDIFAQAHAQISTAVVGPAPSKLSAALNVARYSEDISWAYHITAGGSTKTGTTKTAVVDGQVITLGGVTLSNPYHGLATAYGSASANPFVAGRRYLCSLYVYADKDFWWLARGAATAGDFGQGPVLCRGGYVTRVWFVGVASTDNALDMGSSPTAALGASGFNPTLVYQNANPAATVFVGGMQYEAVPGDYIDGVVAIGDSNLQGGSAGNDRFYDFNVPANRVISTMLASELRVPVFNRGVGGDKLTDMDARWATDISVLKHRCYAGIIYGGTNDIPNGGTLASMSGAVQSMTTKGFADGLRRIYYVTCPPSSSISANPAFEALRQQYNAWLLTTYGDAVYDINDLVEDPATGKDLIGAAFGDGVHFPGAMRSAIGVDMARKLDWSWRRLPSQYVKVQT